MDLNAYERWCVRMNLEHVKTEGLAVVVQRLHANGYHRMADAVEQESHAEMSNIIRNNFARCTDDHPQGVSVPQHLSKSWTDAYDHNYTLRSGLLPNGEISFDISVDGGDDVGVNLTSEVASIIAAHLDHCTAKPFDPQRRASHPGTRAPRQRHDILGSGKDHDAEGT
jgi:hypothetical protein